MGIRNYINSKTTIIKLSYLSIITVVLVNFTLFSHGNAQTLAGNADDIRFLLYDTPEDVDNCTEILYNNNQSIVSSKYDRTKPLKLLIHGALANFKTQDDVQRIKDAYLQHKFDANIILVDYGKLTQSRLPLVLSTYSTINLGLTFTRSETIAKRIAEFIKFLSDSEVLSNTKDIHIIGFGVGAHIAGATGRNVKALLKTPIDRITGLDPSAQLPLRRLLLDASDADYVDVTYTSTGSLALGIRKKGHSQFFVNGGRYHQPNCPNFFPFDTTGCSHTAATYVYAKTIQKSKKIHGCRCFRLFCSSRIANTGRSCPDAELYGEYVSRKTQGNFYVNYV